MTRTAEYRDIPADAPWTTEIVITKAPHKHYTPRIIRLVELTAGWRLAGSAATWQEARFAIRYNEDGRLHGQQFKTRAEAVSAFVAWTGANFTGETA